MNVIFSWCPVILHVFVVLLRTAFHANHYLQTNMTLFDLYNSRPGEKYIYQALTTFRRTSAASILGRFFKKRNVYTICCTDVMPLISIVKATSATHGTRDDRGAVHSRKECRAAGAARPEKETLVAFSGECQKLCSCAALEPCSFACSILFAVHTNLNC